MKKLSFILVLLASLAAAHAAFFQGALYASSGGGGGSPVAFTALHTYYISPTGNDSTGSGTSLSPWATPNHPTVCGDVFIAAAGSYPAGGIDITTQPTSCPSTSGGIDGTGGVYFSIVLCGGTYVGACLIPSSASAPDAGIEVDNVDNWAVEGWQVSNASCCVSPHDGRGFVAYATTTATTRTHHVAFINDIAAGTGQGFQTEEDGNNHNIPGNGVDYFAVIGSIAQNSSSWSQCVGALDVVAPAVWDTNAGTHIYINGNILWNNTSATCSASFDSEALYGDTWNAHGYTQQAVYSNNISWGADRSGLKMTCCGDNQSSTTPTIYWYNNTVFDDNVNTNADNGGGGEVNGELQLDGTAETSFFKVTMTNNIAYNTHASSGSYITNNVYGISLQNGVWGSNITVGTAGNENIITGSAASCYQSSFNATFDFCSDTGNTVPTSTNFFHENPAFANTSDLLTNWTGAPTCTGFSNVTACMGWNANSPPSGSNPTPLTPISDLVPSSTHSPGKGYQLASTTCVSSGTIYNNYPTWLKGVVYLQWNGSTISEYQDLVTKPCGL